MYIKSYWKDITAEDVDKMGKHLLASREQHEREIALALSAAEALRPIAHYKLIDVRACRVIQAAIHDSRASISHTKRPAYRTDSNEYTHVCVVVGGRYGSTSQRVAVTVTMPLGSGVVTLITALEQCEYSRTELERVSNQFTHLEDMIEAEEKLRQLVREIEDTQRQLCKELTGHESSYWHQAVRDVLPTLTGVTH